MPTGLNIKTISDLYMECHTVAYISSRSKADEKVNHCLDAQLNREKEWTRKISAVVEADNILQKTKEINPGATLPQQKNIAKSQLKQTTSEFWHSHVKSLTVQGRFLDLLESEKNNFDWKSIVYNLPARVCKFVINSVSDSLNTRANLHRWGRCMNTQCKGCGNKETLHHILNNCTTFLNQGRYTWRHDNVLSYIFRTISQNNTTYEIFCDLPGKRQNHSTIPVSCVVTNLVPDLCIYSKEEKSLTVIELTVSFELNAESAHHRKNGKICLTHQ